MMAGYRPKSLDELNSIFDRTMEAEKAIRKGSSLLEKGEDSFSSFSADVKAEGAAAPASQEKPAGEISDSVSEFIAKFSAATETETVKAKPKMTVISPEAPKKEFELGENLFAGETEAPVKEKEPEKPSKDELFDEYMKIMSDEDDDIPSEKKLSRKEKKKLRKKEKAESAHAAQDTQAEEAPAENEEPAESAEVTAQTAPTEETAEAQDYAEEPFQPQEETEKRDDFDFPENYTPEWIREEAEAEQQAEKTEKAAEKKSNAPKAILKAFLALVLVAVISLGALATVFKTVVPVNTGKLISDRYYVFTTYKDYAELGLGEGALVVTEKKYAENGEIFAYVDYGSKTFEFGRRTDSITKDDGEMLYVTEKDGGRTLVSRDDCKGVVHLTYEGRGKAVSFLTDNYIVIAALSIVTSLIIALLFALVLRTKKEKKSDESEASEETAEEAEDEFENIFSTIE